jgi:hypothetical protein
MLLLYFCSIRTGGGGVVRSSLMNGQAMYVRKQTIPMFLFYLLLQLQGLNSSPCIHPVRELLLKVRHVLFNTMLAKNIVPPFRSAAEYSAFTFSLQGGIIFDARYSSSYFKKHRSNYNARLRFVLTTIFKTIIDRSIYLD